MQKKLTYKFLGRRKTVLLTAGMQHRSKQTQATRPQSNVRRGFQCGQELKDASW